jgi:hypothetical protein
MTKLFTYFSILSAGLGIAGCSGTSLAPLLAQQSVTSQSAITINIADYCPQTGNHFTDIFALNRTAEVLAGTLVEDFDGDGVPNILDSNTTLDISPYSADTNNDGYSDLLVYILGMTLASQSALPECTQTGRLDSDNDGLSDCEEALLGTSSINADSDGDGLPDYLEIRYGLNPLDPSDARLNPSGDGISNYQKVKMNLPIPEYATPTIAALGYQYSITPVSTSSGPCYDFLISNIRLAQIPNGNQFTFYMLEQANVPATGSIPTTVSVTAQVVVDSQTPGGSQLNYSFEDIVTE